MSMDLGHSKSYIQSISSGRALPSMPEFLAICDYFGISPADFFNENKSDILLLKQLQNETNGLSQEDLNLLISLAKRFKV